MRDGQGRPEGAERGRERAGEEGRGRPPGSEPHRPPTVVDRADYDPGFDPAAPVTCEVCSAEMYYTASCKLRCPRCGYTRDCSDP